MITETEKIKEKKSVQNQILQYVKLWNTSSDIFWQRNHKFSVFLIFHIFKFLAYGKREKGAPRLSETFTVFTSCLVLLLCHNVS